MNNIKEKSHAYWARTGLQLALERLASSQRFEGEQALKRLRQVMVHIERSVEHIRDYIEEIKGRSFFKTLPGFYAWDEEKIEIAKITSTEQMNKSAKDDGLDFSIEEHGTFLFLQWQGRVWVIDEFPVRLNRREQQSFVKMGDKFNGPLSLKEASLFRLRRSPGEC